VQYSYLKKLIKKPMINIDWNFYTTLKYNYKKKIYLSSHDTKVMVFLSIEKICGPHFGINRERSNENGVSFPVLYLALFYRLTGTQFLFVLCT